MKYQHKHFEEITIEAKEVKKPTTIQTAQYGDILVMPGNFIVEYLTGPDKGQKIGMAKEDLDTLYKKTKG